MSINKNAEKLPYYERAREILNYNTRTGEFTRFNKNTGLYEYAGTTTASGYCRIGLVLNGIQKKLLAHRIAWFIVHGSLPNMIDHIDGDKTNNSINNLRECSKQQNSFNRGKTVNNTSGYKGVSWHNEKNKWRAIVTHDGKSLFLGYFNCPKEASEAYQAKAKELHGEFYNETK